MPGDFSLAASSDEEVTAIGFYLSILQSDHRMSLDFC